MADNVTLPGTGIPVASDEIGGIQYQRVKLVWGIDGVAAETSAANPYPVSVVTSSVGATTDTEDGTVADGQSSVSLVVALPYTWDGDNWTRAGATAWPTSIDLDETEEDIKTSAGVLYGYMWANLHATDKRYLRFYNATAASTTVGSTTALIVVPMQPATSGHIWFGEKGVGFTTALCAAATTGIAANDTGAPGANEVVLTVWYK